MSRLVLAALTVLGALTSLAPAASVPPSHLVWARAVQGRFAYGLYFRDQKIGWVIEETRLGKHEGRDVLFSSSESHMATLFDGVRSVKEEKSLTCYELQGEGRILFADHVRRDDGQEVLRRVERDGKKGLRITTRQGGRVLIRTAAMPADTLAHQRQLEAWLRGPRKAGDRFTKSSAAWDQAEIDNRQIYSFKERKTILLSGLRTEVAAVTIDVNGGKLDAVVLPDAHLVTATMGGLLNIRLEKEAAARTLAARPAEVMDLTSIAVNRRLGRARHVDRLELELTGVSGFTVPPSHRQRVQVKKGTVVVQLLRDHRAARPTPLSKEQREQLTKATPRLQSDNEQMRKLARSIVGEETDALKAARRIEAWVHEKLKKSYMDNAETALEVLDRMAGDCTEHALLFVALARAAGIPAREVGGLAYLDGSRPSFGWHAWAELHDGHQWVSVDPTWNQVYVDGTHLTLSVGDQDLAWTNVVGTIKIRVVDVQTRR